MKKFIIQVIVYCLFVVLANFIFPDKLEANFWFGWIAYGIAEGIYYELFKIKGNRFKFVAYPFGSTFTNQSDSPYFNVYAGNVDENGIPFNLKLFEVVYKQSEKENQS